MDEVMNLKKKNQKRKAQRCLKWFRVTLSPTSTVMKFLPTKRNGLHTQSLIWQSFGKVKEVLLAFGGLCPIYRPI